MNRFGHFLTALLCVLLVPILVTGCAVYETRIETEPQRLVKENMRQYFLPKAIISVTASRSVTDGIATDTITSAVRMVADNNPTQNFYLKTNHNFLYDDQNLIETDDEGLLKSLSATSTFKGPEILEKAGEVAGYALKMAVAATATESERCIAAKSPLTIEVLFDPYSKDSIQKAKDILQEKCFTLIATAFEKKLSGTDISGLIGKDKGILYRLRTSFPYSVASITTPDVIQFNASIPDIDKIAIFNYDRGVFVSRKITLDFNNGLLTKTDVSSPSELYGFMQLLLAPVKGVSEAIIGQFGAASDLAKNETIYIQNKNELDKLKNPKAN